MDYLWYKFVYSCMWFTEHVAGKKVAKLLSPLVESARNRNLVNLQKGPKGKTLSIDMVENLDLETFKRKYLATNTPVVIKGGAKNWICCQKWTPDYFEEHFGEDQLPLINAAPSDLDSNEMDYSLKFTQLKTIIQGMREGNKDLYSRFNDIFDQHPELIDDVDKEWFFKHREFLSSGKAFQCFMGGAGTYTHIHAAIQSNFFVQVYGKKKWIMYHPKYNHYLRPPVARRPYFHTLFDPTRPDYEKFPEMEYTDKYEFEIEAGDIFFNPPAYWHHVENPIMSIGFGFRWTSLNAFKLSPMLSALVLLATDPTMFHAIKWRGNFVKVFSFTSSTVKE